MASRILILGNGGSGKAAASLAVRHGLGYTIIDGADPLPDGDFARAIVSPGIPLTHRWIAACRERKIPLASELQFGCEACRERGIRLLAVTGSKGKSSVVKLIAETLSASGHTAVACGNYGLPVSAVAADDAAPEWAVVEVSSFQMETTDLPPDTFAAAAILNLQEDHLDRHGGVAAYHALKRRLLGMASERFECEAPASCSRDLFAGSYFDNEILAGNGRLAIAMLRSAGVGDDEIAKGFADFVPLPHRMNRLGVVRGVECIDDSKATSVAALAAGVTMAGGHVRLIAGGLDKGDDAKIAISPLTKWVKKVYLMGCCAEKFFSAWSGAVDCVICGTLEKAVEAALRDAESGDRLLLSPGAASFDQFKNFGERGDVFARLIKKEGQVKS